MKPEKLQAIREIKFRGWIRDQQRMVGPLSIEEVAKRWSLPLYWCDLMQYTGLHDKNGAEIYLGDILRFKDLTYKDAPERIGMVRFRNGSFCISTEFSVNYAWLNYEREILGNIYEHPHLLGGEQE